MFVISLTYVCSLEDVEKWLSDHIAFLDKHYAQGIFLASGRKVPRTGGVILAIADTREQLIDLLEDDPFYQHGLAEYDITEFIPTKTAQELSFLLEK